MKPKNQPKQSNEQRYYDALKSIADHDAPHELRNKTERSWWGNYEAVLESFYESAIAEARLATKGLRRPTE